MIAVVLSAVFLFAAFATAVEARQNRNNYYQENQEYNGFGNGNLYRKIIGIRNQISDMLGVCQEECELTEVTGILEYSDRIYTVGDVEVHFGPYWYMTKTDSLYDFDGDGVIELIFDELQGLVGSEITLEGYLQSENWLSVFYINGELYRAPGKPIWSGRNRGSN